MSKCVFRYQFGRLLSTVQPSSRSRAKVPLKSMGDLLSDEQTRRPCPVAGIHSILPTSTASSESTPISRVLIVAGAGSAEYRKDERVALLSTVSTIRLIIRAVLQSKSQRVFKNGPYLSTYREPYAVRRSFVMMI